MFLTFNFKILKHYNRFYTHKVQYILVKIPIIAFKHMYFKNLSFLFILFFSVNTFAENLKDSIGIENVAGKKIIVYKIDPKDNYYSIARKYNVSPKSIIEYNKNMYLQIGTIIKIPTLTDYVTAENNPVKKNNSNVDVVAAIHIVKMKETLYSISKLYHMDLVELKKLNNIEENALTIGQELKVFTHKDLVDTDEKPELPVKINKDSTQVSDSLKNLMPKIKYGITEVEDKGTAVWINDNNLDASKSYALHKTAPVGTVIKITNPMTNRSVFAKVVGRYTENETTKDVIIVITKATAEAIGAIDKRFFVTIGYGIPNEN